MSIAIIDYGLANLRSVQKAFAAVGYDAEVTNDPACVRAADKVVVPGVGAFRDGMAQLRGSGLTDVLLTHIAAGRPFLGICLGMQFLFDASHEDGFHTGLGVFPGEVVRFPDVPGLKVPHMGWNTLALTRPDCPLFADLPPDPAVYFTHSYYPLPKDPGLVAATADYPTPFPAAVWRDNVTAVQFHPEKSQLVGLRMLKNFARM